MSISFTLLNLNTAISSYPHEIIDFNKHGTINAFSRDNNNKK